MSKKTFFQRLFNKGNTKIKSKIKVNSKKTVKSTTSKTPKAVKLPQKVKETKNFDPVLQKAIEIEETKIVKKIALEQLKEHEKIIKKERLKQKKLAKQQEKLVKKMPKNENVEKVFKTGIEGFDALLGAGGIPLGTSTIVEGGPGSGKTIFCMQTAISFCRQGKKVLYMSFEEPEERLIAHIENFGYNPQKYIKSGQLVIKRFNALDIARSVEALLSEAKKELLIDVQPILIPTDIKPDLVLIDSLTSIASAFSGEGSRFRIYMEQLFRYLEQHQISSLLIREVAKPGHVGQGAGGSAEEATSFLSDGIIIFYNVIFSTGKRTRAMEILKLRGQPFVRQIVEAAIINKQGLVIYPNKTLKGKYILT